MKIKLLRFGDTYFIEPDRIISEEKIRKILNIDDKIQVKFSKLLPSDLIEYFIINDKLINNQLEVSENE